MIDSTLKIQLLTNSFLHSLPLTCVFVAFILLLSFSSLHFISPLSAGNSGQFSPGYCIKCKSHCIRIFLPFLCVSKCFVCFFFLPCTHLQEQWPVPEPKKEAVFPPWEVAECCTTLSPVVVNAGRSSVSDGCRVDRH